MEFLTNNLMFIIAIISIVISIFRDIYTNKIDEARIKTQELIVKAENEFSKEQAKEKFQSVFDGVYKFLPVWTKYFISKEILCDLIQYWYDQIKGALNNGVK